MWQSLHSSKAARSPCRMASRCKGCNQALGMCVVSIDRPDASDASSVSCHFDQDLNDLAPSSVIVPTSKARSP